jgi:hypothetical protein
MTEVEKSSHSIMEQAFYTKLGPTPDLSSSPAENGQSKLDSDAVRRHAGRALIPYRIVGHENV